MDFSSELQLLQILPYVTQTPSGVFYEEELLIDLKPEPILFKFFLTEEFR